MNCVCAVSTDELWFSDSSLADKAKLADTGMMPLPDPSSGLDWSHLVNAARAFEGTSFCHTHTKYAVLSLRNSIFTAVYVLDPFNMRCDLKLAAHCYGMNSQGYLVFFPRGLHWPFDSMDIFVPDKWSQMSLFVKDYGADSFNTTWY